MRIQDINQNNGGSLFLRLLKSKTYKGISLGILGTVFSIPFILDKQVPASTEISKTSNVLSDKDRDLVLALGGKDLKDLRKQETDWADLVWPTIRTRLINLYKAEREDNKLIKEGKISEKDRKVKIYYADFLKTGQQGDDMGDGPNLHVVKYFDEKQKDDTVLRTYVNEYWPLNEETGGLLPTEVIRIRSQAFKGSLYERDAHKLFVTDVLQVIWSDNYDGLKGSASIYPYFSRQHLYGPLAKSDTSNQMQTFVGAPTWCAVCHTSGHGRSHVPKLEIKRKNYGAIIQDEEFDLTKLPYEEHPGYKKYMTYLNNLVKNKKTTQRFVDSVARDLQKSINLENPYLVEGLIESKDIPWVEGDTLLEKKFEPQLDYGFTYKENGKTWKRANYEHYRAQSEFISLGNWWFRHNAQLIPKSTK